MSKVVVPKIGMEYQGFLEVSTIFKKLKFLL
jgi:hypothetical protein